MTSYTLIDTYPPTTLMPYDSQKRVYSVSRTIDSEKEDYEHYVASLDPTEVLEGMPCEPLLQERLPREPLLQELTQESPSKTSPERTCIIDVGGGLRGTYAAGVLDYCHDAGITFDVGIGVSAGSANIAAFMAHQPRRNFRFYTEYLHRRECMGVENFVQKGSYLDLDYVYETLSHQDGEYPLDYHALTQNPMDFVSVATNAYTGETCYFHKGHMEENDYSILKASASIPVVCKPCFIDGIPYYDGAIADPIPVKYALSMGCTKIVVVLNSPQYMIKESKKDLAAALTIQRKYPKAAEKLKNRVACYNSGIAFAKSQARLGNILIVAPDNTCGAKALKRKTEPLLQLYKKGYHDAVAIAEYCS